MPGFTHAVGHSQKYPSYSVPPCLMPWCLFCTFMNVGSIEHLPETSNSITIEHLLWMVSFLCNRLLQLCRECGSGFFIVRHRFSGHFYIFFSPNPFLNLCNHPLLAVNGFLSLLQGRPCWRFRGAPCFPVPHMGVNWNGSPCTSSAHKLDAFSILTAHASHTGAVTFAVWRLKKHTHTHNLAQLSFSFFTISWTEASFFPWIWQPQWQAF